jgi:hypothetical protein
MFAKRHRKEIEMDDGKKESQSFYQTSNLNQVNTVFVVQ